MSAQDFDGDTRDRDTRDRGTRDAFEVEEPETSLGELTSRLTSGLGDLIQTHIALAKEETKREVKTAGAAAGMLVGGAVAAHLALIVLSIAAGWGLAELMAPGLAFLIVGVVWAVIATVAIVVGRKRLDEFEPAPTATFEEIQEDKQWLKKQP
jgi:uncharacterized membrane protein YqjE